MTTRKDASKSAPPRRRLGRGLDTLISTPVHIEVPLQRDATPPTPPPSAVAHPTHAQPHTATVRMLPVDQIRPNPRQPRQRFDETTLESLAASIKSAGLMQPIVVRPDPPGGFQLVVGERRWRAATRIGLSHLPAVIREIDDQTAAEWGLIENIHREDLNPIERAEAFRRLVQEHGLTHQELADRVGLDRSSVTNLLRLHELDESTKAAVRTGRLGLGHAKALLAVTNTETRRRLAELAIRQAWSVRALERRVAALTKPAARPESGRRSSNPQMQALQRQLSEHLGTKVLVQPGRTKGAGRLVIEFYTFEQFDGLMLRLGVTAT